MIAVYILSSGRWLHKEDKIAQFLLMTLQLTKICLVKPTDVLSRNHLLYKGLKQQFRSKCMWRRFFSPLSFEVLLSSLISNQRKTAKIIRFLPCPPPSYDGMGAASTLTDVWDHHKLPAEQAQTPSCGYGLSAPSNPRDPKSVTISCPRDGSSTDAKARMHPRHRGSRRAARWCWWCLAEGPRTGTVVRRYPLEAQPTLRVNCEPCLYKFEERKSSDCRLKVNQSVSDNRRSCFEDVQSFLQCRMGWPYSHSWLPQQVPSTLSNY